MESSFKEGVQSPESSSRSFPNTETLGHSGINISYSLAEVWSRSSKVNHHLLEDSFPNSDILLNSVMYDSLLYP